MEKLVFIMILGAMPLVLHNCESAKATPTFSKGKEAVQSDIVIIGVYKIETRSDVHLVELRIETNYNNALSG